MIDYCHAQHIIESLTPLSIIERIPIVSAVGRVLSRDIVAPNDMPLFNRSAMDGIALRADDLHDGMALSVLYDVSAGTVFDGVVAKGQCVKIMTGAPVPEGCDTVIRKEYCVGYDTSSISVAHQEPKGANIAYQGEDFKAGDVLLSSGTVVQEFTVGTLASVGQMFIDVMASPRCAVFSTGDEVYEPYEPLSPSTIRNVNAYGVMSQLQRDHYEFSYGGIVPDTRNALQNALETSEKRSDVIIFSGGVSEGDKDFLPVILQEMGYTIIYHGMNIKPGKPQLCAQKGSTLVFGLPGNPVSTILSMRLFVLPALRRLAGQKDVYDPLLMGRWLKPPKVLSDKYHFVPVQAYATLGYWEIESYKTNGSGDIFANARANGYACVAPQFDGTESPFFLL